MGTGVGTYFLMSHGILAPGATKSVGAPMYKENVAKSGEVQGFEKELIDVENDRKYFLNFSKYYKIGRNARIIIVWSI